MPAVPRVSHTESSPRSRCHHRVISLYNSCSWCRWAPVISTGVGAAGDGGVGGPAVSTLRAGPRYGVPHPCRVLCDRVGMVPEPRSGERMHPTAQAVGASV